MVAAQVATALVTRAAGRFGPCHLWIDFRPGGAMSRENGRYCVVVGRSCLRPVERWGRCRILHAASFLTQYCSRWVRCGYEEGDHVTLNTVRVCVWINEEGVVIIFF